jgi:hypothetical protein
MQISKPTENFNIVHQNVFSKTVINSHKNGKTPDFPIFLLITFSGDIFATFPIDCYHRFLERRYFHFLEK